MKKSTKEGINFLLLLLGLAILVGLSVLYKSSPRAETVPFWEGKSEGLVSQVRTGKAEPQSHDLIEVWKKISYGSTPTAPVSHAKAE